MNDRKKVALKLKYNLAAPTSSTLEMMAMSSRKQASRPITYDFIVLVAVSY